MRRRARSEREKAGQPTSTGTCVLFLDENEGLVGNRDSGKAAGSFNALFIAIAVL